MLGPLLYNIDLIDLFLECKDEFDSYANDITQFSVITELERIAKNFFRWFENNHMKSYPGKSHVLLSPNIQKVVLFDNVHITSSLREKLLGVTFDPELRHEEHISKISNIVNKKINSLDIIFDRMSLDKF